MPKTSNSYVTAGNALRLLRKEKGFTLEELAERAQISVSFLSHIERGTRQAPLSTLESLAQILGLNLYELFAPMAKPLMAREESSPYDAKIKQLIKGLSPSEKKSVHHLMKEFHKKK